MSVHLNIHTHIPANVHTHRMCIMHEVTVDVHNVQWLMTLWEKNVKVFTFFSISIKKRLILFFSKFFDHFWIWTTEYRAILKRYSGNFILMTSSPLLWQTPAHRETSCELQNKICEDLQCALSDSRGQHMTPWRQNHEKKKKIVITKKK